MATKLPAESESLDSQNGDSSASSDGKFPFLLGMGTGSDGIEDEVLIPANRIKITARVLRGHEADVTICTDWITKSVIDRVFNLHVAPENSFVREDVPLPTTIHLKAFIAAEPFKSYSVWIDVSVNERLLHCLALTDTANSSGQGEIVLRSRLYPDRGHLVYFGVGTEITARSPAVENTRDKNARDARSNFAVYLDRSEKIDYRDYIEGAEYRIWYATNRRPLDVRDSRRGYGVERDRTVHYGNCVVLIPKSHKIGCLGSPWWNRVWRNKDDRLKLLSTTETTVTEHWCSISEQLASILEDERHAVVFLHGYNVTFQEAALRTAQIGFDLQIQGAMSFFSWPSRGELAEYPADVASIEASEVHIADYLVDFAESTGAKAVHVIAHSMGNRALLRALVKITSMASQRADVKFSQLILAAPDIDSDVFAQLSSAYRELSDRTTLYVSDKDRALKTSEQFYGAARVGYAPPVTVVAGIDTVNVKNIDVSLIGHGYVAEARDVLNDMHQLIRFAAPPEKRMGLRPAFNETGERYWIIDA